MLNENEARQILKYKYDGIKVETGVAWKAFWVFRAYLPIGGTEEDMNPFMSVDRISGAVSDFSIMGCEDPLAFASAFFKAEERG